MRLQLPRTHGPHLTLLGENDSGFVVADDIGTAVNLYSISDLGEPSLIRSSSYDAQRAALSYVLGSAGTRILQWRRGFAPTYRSAYKVLTATGHTVDTFKSTYSNGVGDFNGKRAILFAEERSVRGFYDWSMGHRPLFRQVIICGADLRRGLVFRYVNHDHDGIDEHGCGPTSLRRPLKPRWFTPFVAEHISPNGRSLVGETTTYSRDAIFVRNMSNGNVRSKRVLNLSFAGPSAFAWEDNRHYLVIARGRHDTTTVVRCHAFTGICERATGMHQGRLTMSTN